MVEEERRMVKVMVFSSVIGPGKLTPCHARVEHHDP